MEIDQAAFVAAFRAGLSQPAIARELGVSVSTVQRRLNDPEVQGDIEQGRAQDRHEHEQQRALEVEHRRELAQQRRENQAHLERVIGKTLSYLESLAGGKYGTDNFLKAAPTVLGFARTLSDVSNVKERLRALEEITCTQESAQNLDAPSGDVDEPDATATPAGQGPPDGDRNT